jgi:hypothetical protein
MRIEFSGDRDPHDGHLDYGGSLPPWQKLPVGQCVVWNGKLECYCGNCTAPAEAPERLEDAPEKIPGWTVQRPHL